MPRRSPVTARQFIASGMYQPLPVRQSAADGISSEAQAETSFSDLWAPVCLTEVGVVARGVWFSL